MTTVLVLLAAIVFYAYVGYGIALVTILWFKKLMRQ